MALVNNYSSLRAERIRVARLTEAGAPRLGPLEGYVSDAQIQVQLSPENETGDEGTQKNGGGRICATFKDADRIKRVGLSMDLCQLDYALLALLTQGTTFIDFPNASAPIGYQPPLTTDDLTIPVLLEVWTRAWTGGEQAVPLLTTPSVAYHHWVFPFTKWTLGQTTLDNGIHVFPVVGTSDENSSLTANGPFNDWPVQVADEAGVTACFGVFLDSAIPAASGYTNVPSGS